MPRRKGPLLGARFSPGPRGGRPHGWRGQTTRIWTRKIGSWRSRLSVRDTPCRAPISCSAPRPPTADRLSLRCTRLAAARRRGLRAESGGEIEKDVSSQATSGEGVRRASRLRSRRLRALAAQIHAPSARARSSGRHRRPHSSSSSRQPSTAARAGVLRDASARLSAAGPRLLAPRDEPARDQPAAALQRPSGRASARSRSSSAPTPPTALRPRPQPPLRHPYDHLQHERVRPPPTCRYPFCVLLRAASDGARTFSQGAHHSSASSGAPFRRDSSLPFVFPIWHMPPPRVTPRTEARAAPRQLMRPHEHVGRRGLRPFQCLPRPVPVKCPQVRPPHGRRRISLALFPPSSSAAWSFTTARLRSLISFVEDFASLAEASSRF